MVKQTGIHWKG